MGVGGPANNFVPAISYWAQPKPHGGGANTYDIPEGVETSTDTGLTPGTRTLTLILGRCLPARSVLRLAICTLGGAGRPS